MPSEISIPEWRKILVIIPEEIVLQTFNITTHFYPSADEENLQDPGKNYKYIFPGLKYPRQRETVASNFFSTPK